MIRLFESYATQYEERSVQDCLLRQDFTEKGYYQSACLNYLQKTYETDRIILTASGTQALELAGMIIDYHCNKDGYKVGVSTYSFPSSINAFLADKSEAILLDIDEDGIIKKEYLQASLKDLSALVVTNYAGMNSRIGEIQAMCRETGTYLIEDNALGFLSREEGQYLGLFGDLAVLSFQATKPVSCGEGGALIVNNEMLWECAQILAENGTTRRLHRQDSSVVYTWVGKGTNCRLSELNAAFLYGQLRHSESDVLYRRGLIQAYEEALSVAWGIRIPPISKESNAGMFYVVCEEEKLAETIKTYLQSQKVEAMSHYGSLRESSFGSSMPYLGADEAKNFDACMIRLPLHMKLKKEDVSYICERMKKAIEIYKDGNVI